MGLAASLRPGSDVFDHVSLPLPTSEGWSPRSPLRRTSPEGSHPGGGLRGLRPRSMLNK